MNGLIYNCFPAGLNFYFSPPIYVKQASIIDPLGFLFWGSTNAGPSIDITEDWSRLILSRWACWCTHQEQGVKIKHPDFLT